MALVGEKAAEQAVVGAVVVRRGAAQQAQLLGTIGQQQRLVLVMGDVEALDAVEAGRMVAVSAASTSASAAMSQKGCAQKASPPASCIQPIASATVGRVRPA